jgi:hypothetical protein
MPLDAVDVKYVTCMNISKEVLFKETLLRDGYEDKMYRGGVRFIRGILYDSNNGITLTVPSHCICIVKNGRRVAKGTQKAIKLETG